MCTTMSINHQHKSVQTLSSNKAHSCYLATQPTPPLLHLLILGHRTVLVELFDHNCASMIQISLIPMHTTSSVHNNFFLPLSSDDSPSPKLPEVTLKVDSSRSLQTTTPRNASFSTNR